MIPACRCPKPWGSAWSCQYIPLGFFHVDLSGTPFALPDGNESWSIDGYEELQRNVTCDAMNQTCTGYCGGMCGNCYLGTNPSSKASFLPFNLSVIDQAAFDCVLPSYKCSGGACKPLPLNSGTGVSREECERSCIDPNNATYACDSTGSYPQCVLWPGGVSLQKCNSLC